MNNLSQELRDNFKEFFEKKNHFFHPPSPLIPLEADTTMFSIAGMKQFSDVFLGKKILPYSRVCSIQPCLRIGGHNSDLENVGKTRRHCTYFEMMGNFSFGVCNNDSYFKEEAISFAFEFLTNELKLNPKYFYITVYHTDFAALELWKNFVDENKIFLVESDDNFWQAGEFGPCGPCSEILYDTQESTELQTKNTVLNNPERFLELWNLVFMELNKNITGFESIKPNIDTGMGLERLCSILEKSFDIFKTDLLSPIVDFCIPHTKNLVDAKIVTDHMKSATLLMREKLIPGIEGRNYVLRKLIRRSKIRTSIPLINVVEKIIENSINIYPDLIGKISIFKDILKEEEEQIEIMLTKGKKQLEKVTKIDEEQAVNFHTTHGLPIDFIKEYCEMNNIELDEDKLKFYEDKHKNVSKKELNIFYNSPTIFNGYNVISTISNIVQIINQEAPVKRYNILNEEFLFICKESCFYGTAGGQQGDIGKFKTDKGEGRIIGTSKKNFNDGNVIIHHAILDKGEVSIEAEISLEVNEDSRTAKCRAHSAAHLFYEYLNKKYGCEQMGSFVQEDKGRLDLTYQGDLKEICSEIEDYVNKIIQENIEVKIYEKKKEELDQNILFLEHCNYGAIVRVVKIGEYAAELCGGTHVKKTKDIINFKIKRIIGKKKGIKRIEFITNY